MRIKNNSVSLHFNSLASSYDNYKNRNRLYYETLKLAVKKEITSSKAKILDIGCGTGNILTFLKPGTGIGIDISKNMIKIARKKYNLYKSISYYVHDIEKRAYPGNFDYILFIDVIEHVNNTSQVLKNIYLSMDKNTKLILSMANPLWEPLLIILERLSLKMPEGPHQRITERNLFYLLKKNSLKIVSKKIYLPNINFPVIRKLGLIYVYTIKKIS